MSICTTCGLPKDLCVCETIAKESQTITISIEKKKFGKKYTVIEGFNPSEIDVKEVAKKLKNKFACGGTAHEKSVELQGDHKNKMMDALIGLGFVPETIEIK
jgi:translation initiation factor 1